MPTKDQINAAFGNIKVELVDLDSTTDSCEKCFFYSKDITPYTDCTLVKIADAPFEKYRAHYGKFKDHQCGILKIFKEVK